MAWDFRTDPEFQEQLDWMHAFVRQEIWPLEAIWPELGMEGWRVRSPAEGAGQGSAACGPRICRLSWAGRAWGRCASA